MTWKRAEGESHNRRKRLAGVTIEVPAHWSAKLVPKGQPSGRWRGWPIIRSTACFRTNPASRNSAASHTETCRLQCRMPSYQKTDKWHSVLPQILLPTIYLKVYFYHFMWFYTCTFYLNFFPNNDLLSDRFPVDLISWLFHLSLPLFIIFKLQFRSN